MKPKEKAEELVNKFIPHTLVFNDGWLEAKDEAKQCALIAVDEILNVLPQHEYLEDRGEYHENRERLYWKEVKQEIEKL